MADRFDLEESIMDCWGVLDDLGLVPFLAQESSDVALNLEQVVDYVAGLRKTYEVKFRKLFDEDFKKCLNLSLTAKQPPTF